MFTLSNDLKVLALGAHPDDIELSCGGSLLKLKNEYKADIYTLVFSCGELKSNPKTRTEEQIKAGEFLNVSKSKILKYEDGSILANHKLVSETEKYIKKLNPEAHIEVFGQELNDQSYAICKSDMLIKGQTAENIVLANR